MKTILAILLMSSVCFADIADRPADPLILEMLKEYKSESPCEIVIGLISSSIIEKAVNRAISEDNDHRTNIDKTLAEVKKFRKLKLKQCKR